MAEVRVSPERQLRVLLRCMNSAAMAYVQHGNKANLDRLLLCIDAGEELLGPPTPPVRVIPERIKDDRLGCTCYSYGQGGPHDPSCFLEA